MSTVYAETDRLFLRALEADELPRLVELIGDWEVVRWLGVVPYPYTMGNAESFYADVEAANARGEPEFYAMALKPNNLLIGGVGLHLPRSNDYAEGDMEIGYWLGKDFWGQGFMSEAARRVASLGFTRPKTRTIIATTEPDNKASQNVLRKTGLRDLGLAPLNYATLRGDKTVVKWSMTREEWEKTV